MIRFKNWLDSFVFYGWVKVQTWDFLVLIYCKTRAGAKILLHVSNCVPQSNKDGGLLKNGAVKELRNPLLLLQILVFWTTWALKKAGGQSSKSWLCSVSTTEEKQSRRLHCFSNIIFVFCCATQSWPLCRFSKAALVFHGFLLKQIDFIYVTGCWWHNI